DSRLEELEALPGASRGQGGASEDDGGDLVEELFAQGPRHLNRRGGEGNAGTTARRRRMFDPVNRVGGDLGPPRFESPGEGHQPVVGGDVVLAIARVVEPLAAVFH